MRRLLTAFCLLLSSMTMAQFQGLIVNEFSQGNSGNREYIELLVVGNRTCTDSTADLRGWIFDDQNGWYGTTNGTQGHYRFKDDPNWASVPFGSIILVYNASDKNTSITLADDVSDSNKDYRYIVPIGSSVMEQNGAEPDNNSGAGYNYPAASSLAGYITSNNQWQFLVALNNNNGDVISTVSPANRASAFFSIGYGYPLNPGFQSQIVSIPNVGAGANAYLSTAGYTTASSWIIGSGMASETPGSPNGGGNSSWIQSMRQQVALDTPLANVTQPNCFSATGGIVVSYPNGPGLGFSIDGINYSNSFGVFTGVSPGTYSLTVKNSAGCTSPPALITINPQPVTPPAPVVTVTNPDCNSTTGTLTIVSPTGTGLVYSIDGFNYIPSTVFNNVAPSLYGVSAQNTNGGCTSVATIVDVDPPPPSFTVTVNADTLCPGGTATVSAVVSAPGIYSYTWTVPSTAINPGNVASFAAAVPGIYSVIVSTNWCNATAFDTVHNAAAIIADDKTVCENGTVNLTGQPSGGVWSGTNVAGSQFLAGGLAPGNYPVTYQYVFNGCTVTANAVVTVIPSPTAPVVTVTDHCNNTSTLTASGFTGSLLWSNGAATPSITVNSSGSHWVTQTVNGCTSPAGSGTANPGTTLPAPTASVTQQPTCTDPTGTITVSSPPSGSGVVYSIDGLDYTNGSGVFTFVPQGSYQVTIMNNAGCISAPATVTVSAPPASPPTPAFTLTQPDCNQATGSILVTAPAGPGLSYSIDGSNFQPASIFTNLQPGNYTVTVKDGNGCVSIGNAVINPPSGALYHSLAVCITEGQSYSFNNQALTATGHYTATYQQAGSCDSVVQLYLLVKSFDTVQLQGCGTVVYNGNTFNSSTVITEIISSIVTTCDSIQRTVLIQVGGSVTTPLNVCLSQGQSYNFNGQFLSSSGTYADTLTAAQGCDSIIHLSLMIAQTQVQNLSACGSVIFNGNTYTSSQLVYDTIIGSTGCDSIYLEVNIQVTPGPVTYTTACITQGQVYQFNGQSLATTGHYITSFQQPGGCDSVINLYLLVKSFDTLNIQGCGSINYNGNNYTSSTVLTEIIPSVISSCDSIQRTINIVIGSAVTVNMNACISQGQSYNLNGQMLTTTGYYTATIQQPGTCDSVIQLYLVVKNFDTVQVQGCGTVLYNGTVYNSSVVLNEVIPSMVNGCDSIQRTVNIQIGSAVNTNLNLCLPQGQSYNFNGQSITVSGMYTDTLITAQGCDSIIRLLVVVPQIQSQSISNCGTVIYNGVTYASSAIVYDTVSSLVTGCDSIYKVTDIQVTAGPSSFISVCFPQGQSYQFNGQTLTTSGNYTTVYQVQGSCDSTVNLSLVIATEQVQNISGCGIVTYNSNTYVSSITVRDTIKTFITGCDSIIYVVNILISQVQSFNTSVCLSPGQVYNFNGSQLSTSGHYTDTMLAANGCDSIIHLDLTIATQQSVNISGCGSVMYQGQLYTNSTTLNEVISSVVSGCDSVIRTVQITVSNKPSLVVPSNKTICSGDSVTLVANSSASLQWTGFPPGSSIVVSPAAQTSYEVIATNAQGCSDTAYVVVDVHSFSLQLNASPQSPIAGLPVTIQSSSASSYQVIGWYPKQLFTSQNAYSQQLVVDSSVTISVIAQSANGCMDTATINLVVDPLDEIYIPDAFTPNGDGRNDQFKVLGGEIRSLHLKVFNRWGSMVFESRQRTNGWDGSFGGEPQATGAYVYLLEAELKNGRKITKKGTVILVR